MHLAHNEWDPDAGRSVPKILYGFGREDQLDRDAVKRLVGSLSRLPDPADALAATASADLEFLDRRSPRGVAAPAVAGNVLRGRCACRAPSTQPYVGFDVFEDVACRVMLFSTLDSSVGTRKG